MKTKKENQVVDLRYNNGKLEQLVRTITHVYQDRIHDDPNLPKWLEHSQTSEENWEFVPNI